MRTALMMASVAILGVGTPAFAHRVDEYLQSTKISVEKGRVVLDTRLTPGLDVFARVQQLIDTNRDGTFSGDEQQAYARRVLGDVLLKLDGRRLALQLDSVVFPAIEDMRDGRGAIELRFHAAVSNARRARRLDFENHHEAAIAAYLVNGLLPADSNVVIRSQSRNYAQSVYRMDYEQTDAQVRSVEPTLLWAGLGALAAGLGVSQALAVRARRRRRLASSRSSSGETLPARTSAALTR